jgi:hypothetical protein
MAEVDRPVLALDIDGVLIAWPPEFRTPEPYTYRPPEGFVEHPEESEIRYNPEHGLWIKELLPIFDGVYLSSRRGCSHEDIGIALGLPELDWVQYDGHGNPSERSVNNVNYERRPALEHLFVDRPLVWVDDDLQPIDFDWAAERTERGVPTLLVKPTYYVGLERQHIDEIHSWYGALALT